MVAEEALGHSDAFLSFLQKLSKVAKVDRPILILGERGTGKELAVRRLHFLSSRWKEPLITLNCAALSPELIASELFGHEPGAFTGAQKRRLGRFEAAHRGTLFLDEIGSIPIQAQEKILRVVEYKTFERVGSSLSVETDVRIIGATHADLKAMAEKNLFKRDLLDRLSFEVLYLPRLCERTEDIPLLANHFASRMALELGLEHTPLFSEKAMQALVTYPWPGNIRELKNVVERAVYSHDDQAKPIENIVFDPFQAAYPGDLPKTSAPPTEPGPKDSQTIFEKSLSDQIRDLELGNLKKALAVSDNHQRLAAQKLGLTYDQFRGLYRKYASLGYF